MKKLRKIFTLSVMAITVLSMSFVVAPQADAAQAGDLVKIEGNSAVYYLGADGKRHVFPNEATYFSWYADFSGITTVSQSDLEAFARGANVTVRPGTKLVTSPDEATVYAVEPNGTLRSIVSEENAINLYGADWAKKVVDIIPAFMSNYTTGAALTPGVYPEGTLLKATDAADVYLIDADGHARKFADGAAFLANNYKWDDIVETTMAIPALGTAIDGQDTGLTNVAQNGQGPIIDPEAGTGLTASLAATTPEAGNIPVNSSVEFMQFNLTAANDGDVKVSGIKLTAGGLGTASAIQGVALYNDGNRIGNTKNVDSNSEASFNFSTPLVVQAGTTETITVKAKVVSGTNIHNLYIKSASDVITNGATISGSFPVQGNDLSVVNVTVGQLTIDTNGTPANVDLGDESAILGKFKLTNDNIEDVDFMGIIFKRDSSISNSAGDADFDNLGLYYNGAKIASSDGINNKYVSFVLDNPMEIEKNKIKKLEIRGDVIGGAGKSIAFKLDNGVDLKAIGQDFGYSSKIAGTYAPSAISISAGEVTIEKVNPVNDKVRKDKTDVEFGAFKITANSGETVELSTFKLKIDATGDSPADAQYVQIRNVELYNKTNNTVYELTYDSDISADDSDKLYQNTSMDLYMQSGVTQEFVVRADVQSTATTEDYTMMIPDASTYLVMKEVNNDTSLTDITPNAVSLRKVTVEAPAVTLAVKPLSSALTAVVGETDVELLKFSVKANETSDLIVNEFTFDDAGGSIVNKTLVSDFALFNEAGDLIKRMSANELSGEAIVFDNLSLTVPASETVIYTLATSIVDDDTNNGEVVIYEITGYDIEDAEENDAVYDATNDSNLDGVVASNVLRSARTVTIAGTGALEVSMDNTTDDTDKDIYAIAGTNTVNLAAIKVKAIDEDVMIEDLVVRSSITGISSVVDTLYIYDEEGIMVDSTSDVNQNTTFTDINYVVGQSAEYLYIRAKLQAIGKDEVGIFDQTTLTWLVNGIVAKGDSSGNSLSAGDYNDTVDSGEIAYDTDNDGTFDDSAGDSAATGVSKEFGSLATQIVSVDLVSSYDGKELATKLLSNANMNAAIIKVTTGDSTNTETNGEAIKTLLAGVKVSIDSNLPGSNSMVKTLSIEKIGGSQNAIEANATTSAFASFSTSGNDYELAPGETAYYLVKVKVQYSASGSNDGWIQIGLDNLDGADGDNDADGANFEWKDAKSGASAKFPLRLTKTSIDGETIQD